MAHVSLYRKYRPQTFADIVGQRHVTETLSQALTEDRLHHAYLFTGPRGTGKTSTARILAKAVNCADGPTPTPCNACDQCLSITDGSNVDVIEIDAASHGGVDDVRDLRERVAFAPAGARMKVYIVDECHMLSTAGWNAFLKTVEEPPDHVLFVFATTEPHKVLATILSRTQRFDFRRIDADTLAARVEHIGAREGFTFETGSVALIVQAGDGSARDTESVLEQVVSFTGSTVTVQGVADVLGATDDELLARLAHGVATGDVADLCALVQRLVDAGTDLRQFARDATEHLRALFLLQVSPDGDLVAGTPERLGRLRAQAAGVGRVELLRAVDLLAECQAQMRRGNTRLPLELALAKAALPEWSGDPAALGARIDRLERRSGVSADRPPVRGDGSNAGATPSPAATRSTDAGVTDGDRASRPPRAARSAAPPSDAAAGTAGKPANAAPAPTGVPAAAERSAPTGAAAATERSAPAVVPSQTAGGAPAKDDSAAERATPPDVGGVDLPLVRQSWAAVLDHVKQQTVRFSALLAMGHPVALDGRTLTVEFKPGHRFHADECGADKGQQIIGGALHAVLGARLRLHCVVAAEGGGDGDAPSAEAEAVAEREAMEAAGALPDAEQLHRQAIEALQRGFGATVVDQPGR